MSIETLIDLLPQAAPLAVLGALLLVLVVLGLGLGELRRLRRLAEHRAAALPEETDAIIAELRLVRNALEEVGPMRYAVAGLLAVRREHRLETADIRADVAEILREWEEIDQAVGEIGETVSKVRAAAR